MISTRLKIKNNSTPLPFQPAESCRNRLPPPLSRLPSQGNLVKSFLPLNGPSLLLKPFINVLETSQLRWDGTAPDKTKDATRNWPCSGCANLPMTCLPHQLQLHSEPSRTSSERMVFRLQQSVTLRISPSPAVSNASGMTGHQLEMQIQLGKTHPLKRFRFRLND